VRLYAAFRFDDQETVRDTDDRVSVCVGQSDDETVGSATVPFYVERQHDAAVRLGALAEELQRGVARLRPAVPVAVRDACALPQGRERPEPVSAWCRPLGCRRLSLEERPGGLSLIGGH